MDLFRYNRKQGLLVGQKVGILSPGPAAHVIARHGAFLEKIVVATDQKAETGRSPPLTNHSHIVRKILHPHSP